MQNKNKINMLKKQVFFYHFSTVAGSDETFDDEEYDNLLIFI